MKPKIHRNPARRTLTAVELEMMNAIWRLGSCTVSQVRGALLPRRELAYTSVSTIVRILEQKGFVTSKKAGRGHLYSAAIPKEDFQGHRLAQFVDEVFDRTPSLLVQRLLDSEHLSEEEIARIRALLRKQGG